MDENQIEIPSFYTQSRVDDRYSFNNVNPKIIKRLRQENILTDFDSTSYIRLMKYFKSNIMEVIENPIISQTWNKDHQNEFYIRCYLPKKSISGQTVNDRIDKLIIMFNGLDEIMNYDLYDALGNQLATQGYASILLPTPYHLNRRIVDNKATKEKNKIRYQIPTRYTTGDRAMMYYYNFEKSINELQGLIRSIFAVNNRDYGFFRSLFDTENLKITLFGFSLGGLKALSSFLILKPQFPQIHSCVTWNSGPGLDETNVEFININRVQWSKTLKAVKNGIDKLLVNSDPLRKEYLRICKWIYFSEKLDEEDEEDDFEDLREKLGKLSTNYLSIQSASDKIVSVRSFDRILPSTGLHRLIVPGVDHIPGEDIKWGNWVSKICENIIHFIKGCGEDHFNRLTLEKEIADLIGNTQFFEEIQNNTNLNSMDFSIIHLNSLISEIKNEAVENSEKRAQRLEELYYVSKAFYPKFPELLKRLIRRKKKSKK